MPLFYAGIGAYTYDFEAWRWTFFIPGGVFLLTAAAALSLTQDAPLGDYRYLKENGYVKQRQCWMVLKKAVLNYR